MIPLLAAAAFTAALDVAAVRAPYGRVRVPAAADPTPDRDFRDLRVRDDRGGEVPYAIDPHEPSPRTFAVRAAGFAPVPDAPTVQRATIDLGNANRAVTSLRFATATPAFARDVVIDRSDDGATWTTVANDRVTRFSGGPSHLAIEVGAQFARYWRVSVDDRDDAPLASLRVTAYAAAHELVFPVVRGRRYALEFGDPSATAPAYDLPARLQYERWRADVVPVGRVVALRRRPGYEPPAAPAAPAARGEPAARANAAAGPAWLVSVAFAAAVVVLALFALRLSRTPETTGTPGE